jgi:hypothetical protein
MASTTVNEQPFRFLDLPTELRCCVYESIEFPTTRHVLDRTEDLINERGCEYSTTAGHVLDITEADSRATLIRPHALLEILVTCHLVNEEARPILKRKMEYCRFQPVRYLVDYSAAWALVGPSSALRGCFGGADGDSSIWENRVVKDFLQICALSLSRTRRTQNGVQAIEMTITHKSEIVYGMDVMQTMLWLHELEYDSPTRLVVIYKSPLPRIQVPGDTQTRDSSYIEEVLLQEIPREPGIGEQASSDRGTFVRPLEEEAFEKHVEGLEWY